MKKIFTLCIALLVGGQLIAQKVGPDQLDQIKRMSRKNNHITKTYEGTVEKLVYGFRDIGGPLTSMIFKRSDGNLMLIKFFRWRGKYIKPYLIEGQTATITVSGDPLLLDVVLYKDQYFKELEFSVQAPINGIADLQKIVSREGSIDLSEIEREKTIKGLSPDSETLYNIRIVNKTRMDRLQEMLIMENGDSLVVSTEENQIEKIGNLISYTRMIRDSENPIYYKNPNVHYLFGGEGDFALLVQYGIYEFNTNLLQKDELSLVELKAGSDGIVDHAIFQNTEGKEVELRFNSTDAKQVESLFLEGRKRFVHYQPSQKRNNIMAIEEGNNLIELSKFYNGFVRGYFEENTSTYSGEISRLYPNKGIDIFIPQALIDDLEKLNKDATGFRSLLIDEKTFVIIPSFTAISIGKDIKVGEEIEVIGHLRTLQPGEEQVSDYKIIYPKEITLGRKVYQVKDLFRR